MKSLKDFSHKKINGVISFFKTQLSDSKDSSHDWYPWVIRKEKESKKRRLNMAPSGFKLNLTYATNLGKCPS